MLKYTTHVQTIPIKNTDINVMINFLETGSMLKIFSRNVIWNELKYLLELHMRWISQFSDFLSGSI